MLMLKKTLKLEPLRKRSNNKKIKMAAYFNELDSLTLKGP